MNIIKKWNAFVAEQDELYKTEPDAVKDRIFWIFFKVGLGVMVLLIAVVFFEVSSRAADDLAKNLTITTQHPSGKGAAK